MHGVIKGALVVLLGVALFFLSDPVILYLVEYPEPAVSVLGLYLMVVTTIGRFLYGVLLGGLAVIWWKKRRG